MLLRAMPLVVLSALVFLLCAGGSASGAPAPDSSGVLHACVVTKGKARLRGTVRVVSSPRSCKRRRGERAIAWNVSGTGGAAGPAGPAGQAGAAGTQGVAGLRGADGATGPTGQVDEALLNVVQEQSAQIAALQGTVASLQTELTNVAGGLTDLQGTVAGLGDTVTALEGTVAGVCAQVSSVATTVNKLTTAVSGITLLNVLKLGGLGLSIPALPNPVGTSCP